MAARRGAIPGASPPPAAAVELGRRLHADVVAEVRRRLARSPGGHLVNGRLDDLELRLRVSLSPGEAGAERLAADLDAAIAGFVEETVEAAAAFRPGRAFCHRCESAECLHSAPGALREVFAAYTATGVPLWADFGQLCLDHRHPRIDRLYDETRPEILLLELDGGALKAGLLPEFHRSARRHDVAGELCAGFFPLPGLRGGERGVALTFQVVVTRRGRAGRRVGLNLIAGGPAGEAAIAAAPPAAKPWRGALLWGQAQLAGLSRRSGRVPIPDEVLDERVRGILRGLRRRIERDLKGRGRRTLHAEERHRSGERPTRKAVDDLREAAADAVFVDARHETLVVLGERNRAHFFSPDGRLVSSVHYPRETIARKIRLGHWKPAPAAALAELRVRLEQTTSTE
jgi:hypothetical protein